MVSCDLKTKWIRRGAGGHGLKGVGRGYGVVVVEEGESEAEDQGGGEG